MSARFSVYILYHRGGETPFYVGRPTGPSRCNDDVDDEMQIEADGRFAVDLPEERQEFVRPGNIGPGAASLGA
jgi:hypothetical protein